MRPNEKEVARLKEKEKKKKVVKVEQKKKKPDHGFFFVTCLSRCGLAGDEDDVGEK